MLEAFDFILFGGAGDLAQRKLIPGMYRAFLNGELPEGTRIIPTCRDCAGVDVYKEKVRAAAEKHLRAGEFSAKKWDAFVKVIFPVFVDISKKDEQWEQLAELLNNGNAQRVFYLATPPGVFGVC